VVKLPAEGGQAAEVRGSVRGPQPALGAIR
jgi:hypothetical protein